MGVAETFRKIGLADWVVDFTSPAKTLKKAKMLAATSVPAEALAALREECSSERIFKKYAEILSAPR